jgi:hypothetical protein
MLVPVVVVVVVVAVVGAVPDCVDVEVDELPPEPTLIVFSHAVASVPIASAALAPNAIHTLIVKPPVLFGAHFSQSCAALARLDRIAPLPRAPIPSPPAT